MFTVYGCRTFESHCNYVNSVVNNVWKALNQKAMEDSDFINQPLTNIKDYLIVDKKCLHVKMGGAGGFGFEFKCSVKEIEGQNNNEMVVNTKIKHTWNYGENQLFHGFLEGLIKCFRKEMSKEEVLEILCSEKGFYITYSQLHNLELTNFDEIVAKPYTDKEDQIRKDLLKTQQDILDFIKANKNVWGRENRIKFHEELDNLVAKNHEANRIFRKGDF